MTFSWTSLSNTNEPSCCQIGYRLSLRGSCAHSHHVLLDLADQDPEGLISRLRMAVGLVFTLAHLSQSSCAECTCFCRMRRWLLHRSSSPNFKVGTATVSADSTCSASSGQLSPHHAGALPHALCWLAVV